MNRENILNEICLKNCTGIDCDTPHECSDMCKALLNKLLDKYEKQIRAEVISEISREMRLLYGNEYEQKVRADAIEEYKKFREESVLAMVRHHENINKQIAEEFSKADMEKFMEYVKEQK